jgi:hypothetical protein
MASMRNGVGNLEDIAQISVHAWKYFFERMDWAYRVIGR